MAEQKIEDFKVAPYKKAFIRKCLISSLLILLL